MRFTHALALLALAAAPALGIGAACSNGPVDTCNLVIQCPCNDGTTQTAGCDSTCEESCADHGGERDGGAQQADGG